MQAEDEARRQRDENLEYDEVWCVFDVDEHPRVADARKMAIDNNLRLAMSNACFELWLILHLRENPGPQHRHDLQRMLAELMPGLGAKHIDFEKLIVGYDAAFGRAERLEHDALEAGEPGRDPTTEVFHLTDSIDEAGRERRLAKDRHLQGQLAADEASKAKAKAAADAAYEQAAREEAEGGKAGKR